MRRASICLVTLLVGLTGCKKIDELQAALDAANAKLAGTEQQLGETEADLLAQQQANAELVAKQESYEQTISEMEAEIQQLNAQIDDLAAKAGVTARELAELRKEKAKREAELRVYKDLFASLKAMVDAGTIKVVFRKGRMVVKLDNSILFDSGKTKLKPEGEQALAQLTKALNSVKDRDWLVAGNTDNIPIKTKRFANNWELSTARAVNVVTFMIEQGMAPSHVGAAGYGEFDPVADNKSPEGRAENRRIEVILMPSLGDIPGMKEMLTGR
jgi:chemotaxis protein MotB